MLWRANRRSHEEYSAYSTPLVRSLDGKEVVIVHGWYDIKGYDLKTGNELWSYPIRHEGMHLVASPVSDDGRLYTIGAKQITALDISKLGTENDPLLWSTRVAGEKSSTPVVVAGLMFLVTETGMAFCLDTETGEIQWKERFNGRYFSSVIAVADRVLFTNEGGRTVVVVLDRMFQQLGDNTLDGGIYASLAPAGSQLFVRTTRYLYCLAGEERVGRQ